MGIPRHVVLFVLILATPWVALLVFARIAEHHLAAAVASTEAVHQRINNAAALEPNGIADSVIVDQVYRVPSDLGRVESFWPTLESTSGGLFGSSIFMKGIVMFARGSGRETLRWRIAWWHRPVLEKYQLECFPTRFRHYGR